MAEFVFAVKTHDIPAGQGKTISLGEKRIALFNVPLGEGELEGCRVTCPWHGWKFDVGSGEMTMNAAARVNCYPTRVDAGDVQVCG